MAASILTPAQAFANPADDMPTTNIGSSQWEKSQRYKNVIRKVDKQGPYIDCPKNYYAAPIGKRTPKIVDGTVTGTTVSINPKKYMVIKMQDGTKKRVRQGTMMCTPVLSPMSPPSVEVLSQWTFAPLSQLARAVGITRPPIQTCTPAVAPTAWEGTFISKDLVSATTNSGDDITGAWTIQWKLTGGQGILTYPTRVKNKQGSYIQSQKTTVLQPEGTTIEVTELMENIMGFAIVTVSWQPGSIAPDCGQQYLPEWSKNWYDYHNDSIPFDTQFHVQESDGKVKVLLDSEAWGR
jgi:hypothetical protein